MENILLILSSFSFLIFWIVFVILYTPSCYNLRAMLDSIDKNGELTETKAPLSWYLTNLYVMENWTIKLPTDKKYLQYDIVNKTIEKIKIHRKILAITAPIMIICGVILLLNV